MFARFVCALLCFRTREFPAKYETREPEKLFDQQEFANMGQIWLCLYLSPV